MKPAPFRFHAPESCDDVVAVLTEHGDEAKPLAGGQSLVPLLALRLTRFGHLVDLGRVSALCVTAADPDSVTVGSMVRQADAGRDGDVARLAPLVSRAIPLIGHFQIRNRGTVGGSLVHADAASELPAVALALDATLHVVGPAGARSIRSDEFFLDRWTTALAPDELLVGVRFPAWSGRCGFAIEEVARRHGDFAMVGAACALELDDADCVRRARVALMGVASTPIRAIEMEAALAGTCVNELHEEARHELGRLATRGLDPPADVHATAQYRRSAGALLVARALGAALQEAADG